MKEKEKSLLLQDLCARLPYGVKVHIKGEFHKSHILEEIDISDRCVRYFENMHLYEEKIEDCKPYLRPLSSMTDKEDTELVCLRCGKEENVVANILDFYNSHYFDYRGLIPLGLAFIAPDGMYNVK